MTEFLSDILDRFHFEGKPLSCTTYGSGHINSTFLVVTDTGRRYILQNISSRAFKDVPGLMNNVRRVTEHLRRKCSDPRSVLRLVDTDNGLCYISDGESYWRMYDFVEDSLCLQLPESDEDFYQSAVGFAGFMDQLSDFPAEELIETIPNFHNTPDRFRQFREALERDPLHRAALVPDEIEFALRHEKEMGTLQAMRDRGELPVRVTHNDTKLNNVLFDAAGRTALCIIDLDTVMPGLSVYDYGCSIRFGASTALEDEKDLRKVALDLHRFRVFTGGFLRHFPSLTEREIEMLPLGAKTMTFEDGLRFLTDYINGDIYYSIHYPTHNLVRCHTQFKLVTDIESKWDAMNRIVRQEHEAAEAERRSAVR